MSERGKKWEEFETNTIPEYIERIKDSKRQLKKSRDSLYSNIEELGKRIEEFLPKDDVAASLKHYLKNIVSNKTIDRALKPKEERKKVKEETANQLEPVSQIDDKKVIVETTTSGQSVVEPEQSNQNKKQEITPEELAVSGLDEFAQFDQVQTQTQTPKPVLEKVKKVESEKQELLKTITNQSTRINQLENQIKNMVNEKPDQTNEIKKAVHSFNLGYEYDPSKSTEDPNKKYGNTIVCDLRIADFIVKTLQDKIIHQPDSYYLIQQNFDNPIGIRINYLKTNFKT